MGTQDEHPGTCIRTEEDAGESDVCACVCVCVCVCVCGEEVGEMERGGEELKSGQRETNPLATHAFNFFFHAFNF